jgi:hypothetical protein
LAGIPSIKANSVFQLVFGVLKVIAGNKTVQVLLIILSASLVMSCQRHSIPPQINPVDITDSVSTMEKVVYRDTTIIIPGATIQIHDTIPCKGVIYHVQKDSAGVEATVDLNKGVLTVTCKEDSLRKVLLNMASDYISLYKQKNTTIRITVPGPVITKWYIPKWVWYVLGADALYIIWWALSVFILPGFSISSIFKHRNTKW